MWEYSQLLHVQILSLPDVRFVRRNGLILQGMIACPENRDKISPKRWHQPAKLHCDQPKNISKILLFWYLTEFHNNVSATQVNHTFS
jgi:hypothetical protein